MRNKTVLYFLAFTALVNCRHSEQSEHSDKAQVENFSRDFSKDEVLPFPLPQKAPSKVFVYGDSGRSNEDNLLIETIAGHLAKRGSDRGILLSRDWEFDMAAALKKHRPEVEIIRVHDVAALVSEFSPEIEGYILVNDINSAQTELNALATSNSFWVLTSQRNEELLIKAGIKRIGEVPSDEDQFVSNYSKKALCLNDPKKIDYLADWAIYSGCRTTWKENGFWWDGTSKFFENLDRPFSTWGWASSKSLEVGSLQVEIPLEHNTVRTISMNGGFFTPSDFSQNLAIFNNFRPVHNLQPKPYKKVSCPKDRHILSFLMSDGDNLAYLARKMLRNGSGVYTNSKRGSIPVGWTVSPAAAYVAPIILEEIYSLASENDSFVAAPSGVGYAFPSSMDDKALENFAKLSEIAMERAGLDTVNHINTSFSSFIPSFQEVITPKFLNFDFLKVGKNTFPDAKLRVSKNFKFAKGIISYTYANYSQGSGQIQWADDVPVISGREKLMWPWEPEVQVKNIVTTIKKLPRDTTKANGYSLIPVNIWSYGLDHLSQIADELKDVACVVTPNQMIEMIRENKSTITKG